MAYSKFKVQHLKLPEQIRSVDLRHGTRDLRLIVNDLRKSFPSPGGESIVASHSLIPDALYHAFAAYGVLLSPDLPLSRRQHEMIATVVSATNRCFY